VLITGQGRYAGDLHPERLLYAAMCRSTVPHGRLVGIDLEVARAMPGVVAAFAAADLPEIHGVIPDTVLPDLHSVGRPVLAKERVRYVGEPVAVVVAENAYLAADAAAAVVIDTEPLSGAGDVLTALAPGAAHLHPPHDSNVAGRHVREYGDIEAAFAQAAFVERNRYRMARVSGGYMEPRACCAEWHASTDSWELWTSTQWVHGVRDSVAAVLGVEAARIRVRAENVGGGFGPKGGSYPEEVLVALLARRLERPVQWVASRSEDTASSLQAHGDLLDVEAAVDAEGHLLGLKAHLMHDIGAYAGPGTSLAFTVTNHLVSAYKIPAYRADIDFVYTNAVPGGFIRGGGREIGNFAIERTMDHLAARLGLDGVEIRRRNLISSAEMPYATGLPGGVVYDGGDYAALLDGVSAAVEHERHDIQRGVGVSMSVERTGIGIGEEARVAVHPDGSVVARLGSTPGGQGHETTFAQVVATSLGWPIDRVTVLAGDSNAVPRAAVTAASRSAFEVGNASALAASAARRRLLDMGAQLIEADAADLVLTPDGVHVRGAPGRSIKLSEMLREGPLEVAETFKAPPAYASACHAAVVEVDPELGSVNIVRYVIGHDSGRSINPLLVEGQLHGGYAHGIGYALLEEAIYLPDGAFISGTFLDYLIPSAGEVSVVPEMIKVEAAVFGNPEGFKGAGESATIPAPAAIAAAIEDAVRKLGGNVTLNELPITPQRLFDALRKPSP
jgi:carbon-monoxide dehydrogenase large subunit